MRKTLLNKEEIEDIENELVTFSLIESYLKNRPSNEQEFTSIRRAKDLSLFDEIDPIQNIVLMQDKSGKTIVLKQSSRKYSFIELQDMIEKYGFDYDDIISLLQTGMSLEEIDQAAERYSSEPSSMAKAIREMIKVSFNPNKRREQLQNKSFYVRMLEDVSIQVDSLQKIAEVDENGRTKLEPELLKSIEIFGIKLPDEMYIKENEPTKEQRSSGSSLEVVSSEEKDKDRQNVEKIATDLNMNPDDIISIIRIDDNDNGSKLLNDATGKDTTKYIIRTRNGITQNKFIVAEERNGRFEQSQGFEFTPVAKEVASLLKDTQGRNGYSCNKARRN